MICTLPKYLSPHIRVHDYKGERCLRDTAQLCLSFLLYSSRRDCFFEVCQRKVPAIWDARMLSQVCTDFGTVQIIYTPRTNDGSETRLQQTFLLLVLVRIMGTGFLLSPPSGMYGLYATPSSLSCFAHILGAQGKHGITMSLSSLIRIYMPLS